MASGALTPNASPRHLLGAELRQWRQARGLSVAQLAELVYVSRELLQKVETAHRNASQDLVAACDTVLDTGGALARLLHFVVHQEHEHEHAHPAQTEPEAEPPVDPPVAVPVTILITVTADVLPPTGLGGQLPGPQLAEVGLGGSGDARIYQFPTSRHGKPSR